MFIWKAKFLKLINVFFSVHPTAMAVALQHQLTAVGMASILKPATGVAAVTGLTSAHPSTALSMPSEAETTASTLALLDPPGALLHPALRGVKAINISKSRNCRVRVD